MVYLSECYTGMIWHLIILPKFVFYTFRSLTRYRRIFVSFYFILHILLKCMATKSTTTSTLIYNTTCRGCCLILDTFRMKQTQMYVCTLVEFILVEIWIHYCMSWRSEWSHWKIHWYLYKRNNGREMWELLLGANWQEIIQENYNDMRNCHFEWTNVWSVIPLFASRLTPVSVNSNHHWL